MNKYYLEIKTWREGIVEMPGLHTVLAETNDYRPRINLKQTVPQAAVKDVFFSFSESKIQKFLNDHVSACIVALVVEAEDEQAAVYLVDSVLGPIEVEGIMKLDDSNKHLVSKKLQGTDDQSPVVH
jgi:hypothetical protein